MKIGDRIDLDKCRAVITSIEKPPGFRRRIKVILKLEYTLEELENELSKKSAGGTSGKKKKTTRRKS